MKIVVTGGAGFLGLHCAKLLCAKKHDVILVDIAPFERSEYPKTTRFVHADIRDTHAMKQVLIGVDAVIHAAAALPLWSNEEIMSINVEGTRNILECSKLRKVKRFVYVSSTAVYGVPKTHPILESSKRIGVGAYGTSKILAEDLCDSFRKKEMVISIIRPKTFVGTYRLGVFEILFDWIKDGKQIPVIGSGNNRYQLLDVDDLVEAMYRLITLKSSARANSTFNIGARHYDTVKKDLEKLFQYAKSGSKVLATPAFPIKTALWIFEKLRISPLYQWVYDTADKDSFVSINQLTNTLHWQPKYSNAETLIKSYQWYLDNYREIKSRPQGVTHRTGWKQGILGLFKRFL